MSELEKIVSWLNSIGLKVIVGEPPEYVERFLPDVVVFNGEIYVTQETKICNLLHDAGHVAVTPAEFRSVLTGDLSLEENEQSRLILENKYFNLVSGQDELFRLIHGGEQAAIAWSYAAGFVNNLNADIIFPKDLADIENAFRMSHNNTLAAHPGIAELYHSGMIESKAAFPKMKRWLQI